MNVVLKYGRDLLVMRMVEELRNSLQRWFSNRQQQALVMKIELTTWVNWKLYLRFNRLSSYEVDSINFWEFNVKYVGISDQVNLQIYSCTCKMFDLNHISCTHAIIACRYGNMSCYIMCSQYYEELTYIFIFKIYIFY